MAYAKSFEIRWSDLDPNRHLRGTAYEDFATHVRFSYLAERGFPVQRFAELGIGPVILKLEIGFFREAVLGDTLAVGLEMAGMTKDRSRFRFHHDITKSDGTRSAQIDVDGAWLDLSRRKITTPPEDLRRAMEEMPRAQEFADLD